MVKDLASLASLYQDSLEPLKDSQQHSITKCSTVKVQMTLLTDSHSTTVVQSSESLVLPTTSASWGKQTPLLALLWWLWWRLLRAPTLVTIHGAVVIFEAIVPCGATWG